MNWQEIKEKYQHFKQWQRQPMKYADCDDVHYCNNCGLMFSGNFCPRCSQKADIGRINWRSVRNGIMDIWGLGTRSLIYSIWQLLMRPGYFISDYISGKRQVSFPPVKMLFIVTVIYSLIIYWLFPKVFGIQLHDIDEGSRQLLNNFYEWYESHFSWAMLGMSVLAIIPTWVMFRYAPRNTRHSLPEGFFIQVLLSVLMVVLNFFLIYLVLVNLIAYNVAIALFTMFYYIVGYMQLFGYGFWGTLWREAFVLLPIVLIEFGLIFAFFGIDALAPLNKQISADEMLQMKIIAIGGLLLLAVMIMAVGWLINLIATRKARKSL
jgi:hypothetical protein